MRVRRYIAASLGLSAIVAMASVGFAQNNATQLGNQPRSGFQTQVQPTSSRTPLNPKVIELDNFRVECLRKIEVPAQADGLIQELEVDEGITTPQGGLLFRIDNRVALAQKEVASKKLESAQKQAKEDAELKFAEASHEFAQAEYETELRLLEKGSTTQSSVQRKRLEATKTRLSIDAAKVKHETDVLAVGVAAAELNAADVQLSLYNIVAPWDAYINERLKNQGAWVRAGEPVLKIHQMSEMKVAGYIKLKALSDRGLSINNVEGAKIRISVPITPTQKHVVDTVVSFVSSEIDDTDSIRVSARIRNEQLGNSWLLRDGQPAAIAITIE
jgi:multidrug resistance efflux pump